MFYLQSRASSYHLTRNSRNHFFYGQTYATPIINWPSRVPSPIVTNEPVVSIYSVSAPFPHLP